MADREADRPCHGAMMNDPRVDSAWKAFQDLSGKSLPHEVVQQMRDLFVPQDLIDELVKRHNAETAKIASLKEPLALSREGLKPWYMGPQPNHKNWPAYRDALRRTLGSETVDKIDDASSRVLYMLDHPATPSFRSRGLVVGHVQSGKTSNFTAVVSKAADSGYRMFIVLSGVHNALRRQTQSRLIRDLVSLNPPLWHQITKVEHDFVPPPNAPSFLASKDQTLLLVVKKNTQVLEKLRDWLDQASEQLVNCPTLIIDDEADQVTLATRRINPLIRQVMARLPKVCYIGYTATPFANLLVEPTDEGDFYPRDFILSLPRGPEYQGPETLFGRNPLDGEDPSEVPGGRDMIREIRVRELADLRPANNAAIAGFEPQMTDSLRKAVLWFWLATGIRYLRGQADQHSSMLIHAHSNTRIHDSYGPLIRYTRDELVKELEAGSAEALDDLRRVWTEEVRRVPVACADTLAPEFEEVLEVLAPIVKSTRVVMDHYRSEHRLDYESEPVNVIAIGGNTLSRGLTLEGLVVSFFVRSSNVYDTLLQMGRWFGYRPGYEDLPRIFMPAETRRWFTHLATVEEEMRSEIDRFLVEHKSPLDLAVRIRCHPKMRVTAPSRMRSAVRVAASYGDSLVETRYFQCWPRREALEWHEQNAAAVKRLLSAADSDGQSDPSVKSGKALWRGVAASHVLDFLGSYQFDPKSTNASAALMSEYVRRRNASSALRSWNVGVIGTVPAEGVKKVALPGGREVGAVVRARIALTKNDDVADIKTLTGTRDEALDLEIPAGIDKVNRGTLVKLRTQQAPERGLVLLYPIDSTAPVPTRHARKGGDGENEIEGRAPLDAPGDIVWGVALVFPRPVEGDAVVEYDYVAADLSKVFPDAGEDEDEDISVLDQDLDSDSDMIP